MKKSKTHRLPSAWSIFRDAIRDYLADWRSYLLILGIIAIPTNLLSLSSSFATDLTVGAYVSCAILVMNVALVWAMVRRQAGHKVPRVASAYYDGSAAIVRYTLTTILTAFMLLPLGFGLSIYATSLATEAGITTGEQIVVTLIALLFATPSLFLMVRFGLGTFVSVRDELRPMAALRRSRVLTLGRFWPVAGRLALMVLFLLLLSVPAVLITIGLAYLRLGNGPAVFFETASTLITLPIANLFMLRLYQALVDAKETISRPAEPAAEAKADDAQLDEPKAKEEPAAA